MSQMKTQFPFNLHTPALPQRAVLLALFLMANANGTGLAPPPYELKNRHGVNVASGAVSPSLTDVSIGGALGLQHSISTFSSNFVNWEGEGPVGYRDMYYGRVLRSIHHKPPNTEYSRDQWVYVMQVFDTGGSKDFSINSNGTYTAYDGDPRHTLDFVPGTGFIWTKPDGTITTYGTTRSSYDPSGINTEIVAGVSEIKYPNGFTVSVSSDGIGGSVYGVTTNTGYQLKYVYTPANTTLDLPDDPTNDRIPPIGWYLPKYIVGINNTIDYCPSQSTYGVFSSIADACGNQLTRAWPTATHNWPGGMPRVMYLGETTFSVTNALGGVTEFKNRPYPYPDCPAPGGGTTNADPKYRTPRIVAIKPAEASSPTVNYEYKSDCVGVNGSSPWTYYIVSSIAKVSTSYIGTDTIAYTTGTPYYQSNSVTLHAFINGAGGYNSINTVYSDIDFGLMTIDAWNVYSTFEQARSNRMLTTTDKLSGVVTELFYDGRYNLTMVKKNGQIVQTAAYPTTCDNRKTCNQALWIKDARNNQTDYEYDPYSGQVTRVRQPADITGVRPETRYTYEPKYAYYKKTNGSYFEQASSPVYLLTRERKCIKTAMLADGSGCSGGATDEITTDYEYGSANAPNNLNLHGVVVTAFVNGAPQVRRTCYAYDAYSNRIGETKPQAGLTNCP